MKLLVMQFSPASCYLFFIKVQMFISLNRYSSFSVRDQVSHPYKTRGKIIVLYILVFMFSDSTWKHNQAFAAMSLNVHTEKKYTCLKNNVTFTF